MSRFKNKFQNRNQIAQLLETKNKKEQLERIQALQQMSSMPVFDIVCRFDPRTNDFGFSIIGGQLTLEQTIDILEKGLDELRMKYIEEKNAKAEAEMENAPPDKMKGKSGHRSGPPVKITQHESDKNKEKRLETEEQPADESLDTEEVPDDESTRT